jgi:hypothetical protein
MVSRIRHPGWSWSIGKEWLIPSAVAGATLFLGAALGVIPSLAAGSWKDAQTRITLWVGVALGAAGLLALLSAWVIWCGRKGILRSNGTAYIIQEFARGWSADDARSFLASARRQFARMIDVPGPGTLDGSWDWPLNKDAQQWDSKVTELVHAFQALRHDDDPFTPKGIFIWAWAPVAIAFGARVSGADRGLMLDVWQRPSRGRAGDIEMAPWSQRPHRFGSGRRPGPSAEVLQGSAPPEYRWPARVIVNASASTAGVISTKTPTEKEAPLILLVRLGRQAWGPISEVPSEPNPGAPLTLVVEDVAGLNLKSIFHTEIREFRVVPPSEETHFAWDVYPALVSAAGTWIRRQASGSKRRPVMIGTVVPQEVALGLGIDAAQLTGPTWPTHLWPIVAKPRSHDLVIPRLNLGSTVLPPPNN